MTRTGKIARLPREVREELNRRLRDLSDWKTGGGYPEWLARQEELEQAQELAADAEELEAATDDSLADHLARRLKLRYATELANWNGEVSEEFRRKLRALRSVCQDLVGLRRADYEQARLATVQERFDKEEEAKRASALPIALMTSAKLALAQRAISQLAAGDKEEEERRKERGGSATRDTGKQRKTEK